MRRRTCVLFAVVILASPATADASPSHPPLRPLPEPSDRPLTKGSPFFVDPAKGNDLSGGSQDGPWKTITHALQQISAHFRCINRRISHQFGGHQCAQQCNSRRMT